MAAGKEIRGKIKSVENTKKITKAMEMVAVSKMRKAQERMRAARPYSDEDPQHCHQPGQGQSRVRAQLHEDERRQVGWLIVVTTDKGLCGG
jgi:F-type H+-transporting ATPase subunit gamma